MSDERPPGASTKPDPLLGRVGGALRARRLALRLTGEEVARRAGLSRRFIAMVESGKGNISLLNLLHLCEALGSPLHEIVAAGSGRKETSRIAVLLGLRGAGKSTLGPGAAKAAGARFVELDAAVEARAGMTLAEIFSIHGEAYFRELEAVVLRELVDGRERLLVATSGGIVAHQDSLSVLRERCTTIWLKATPEHHWSRVAKQGDRRPLDARSDARAALKELLRHRRPLYAGADHVVDTSRLGVVAAQKKLNDLAKRALGS